MLNRRTSPLLSARLVSALCLVSALGACGSDPTPFTLTYSVAAGDLNGDGRTDLASGNTFVTESQHPGHVSVILQSQSSPGSFLAAQNLGVGANPSGVAIGDLNGDGLADIAQADQALADRADVGVRIRFQIPGQPGTFRAPILVGN